MKILITICILLLTTSACAYEFSTLTIDGLTLTTTGGAPPTPDDPDDPDPGSGPSGKLFGTTVNRCFFDTAIAGQCAYSICDPVMTSADKTLFFEKLLQYFTTIQTENQAMWSEYEITDGGYNWDNIDDVVNYGTANGLPVTLVNIVYDKQLENCWGRPEWYDDLDTGLCAVAGSASAYAAREAALEANVRAVVDRYEDTVDYLFINEPIAAGLFNKYMCTSWNLPEAISNLLIWANDENSDAKLWIGEYDVLDGGDHYDEYLAICTSISTSGQSTYLYGINFQTFFGGYSAGNEIPSDETLRNSLDAFAALGYPLRIGELSVTYSAIDPDDPFTTDGGTSYDSWWDYQAWALLHLLEFFENYEYEANGVEIEEILFWGGITDKASWHNTAIYDESWNEKPAFDTVTPFLLQRK